MSSYVPVPTPVDLVPEVLRYIADRIEDAPGGATTKVVDPREQDAAPSADEPVIHNGWTASQIEVAIRESPPSILAIVRAIAERPAEGLMTPQLAAAMGPDKHSGNVAGALGAFGRRCKRYGKEGPWFFDAVWNESRGGVVYTMPEHVAELVLRILDSL